MKIHHAHLILYLILAVLIAGCNSKKGLPSNTLYGTTLGYWEWVSTTTPNGTITPQTVGYTQQMQHWVDPNPQGGHSINYIAFYKNDTLQRRYNETDNLNMADDIRNTIIMKYDTIGYIKWYVTPNSTYIQFSASRNPYTLAVDTIRSVYKYNPDLKLIMYPY